MKKNQIGYFIIASAILWGIVIVGCALTLKGTQCFSEISLMLNAGAGIHLILIWGPVAAQIKKYREQREIEENIKE